MQLAEWNERFEALGVTVAGMTYDSQDVLSSFHAGKGLPYPLLQDEERKHVEAYGVRNEDYGPGHAGYGVPHPGIVYVDADGIVRAKFAVEGYRGRPPFEDIYAGVSALLKSPQ